jgi:hypothetical protein
MTLVMEPFLLPVDVWGTPRPPMNPAQVMHRAVLLQGLALKMHLLGERLRDGEGDLDADMATTLDRIIEISLEVRSSLESVDERVA